MTGKNLAPQPALQKDTFEDSPDFTIYTVNKSDILSKQEKI